MQCSAFGGLIGSLSSIFLCFHQLLLLPLGPISLIGRWTVLDGLSNGGSFGCFRLDLVFEADWVGGYSCLSQSGLWDSWPWWFWLQKFVGQDEVVRFLTMASLLSKFVHGVSVSGFQFGFLMWDGGSGLEDLSWILCIYPHSTLWILYYTD